ncbi:Protein ASPARTIC PROTEASE IN GUARD CELL 2 [Platanthera guangdongensis]|uniref:Protein ASPARTIC PROTEASE IN GUARD CELL 2 n=1 Tax=Platanthera guangdongensis TaxID=2320717 RepID=A0ABR2MHC6_9ASPA
MASSSSSFYRCFHAFLLFSFLLVEKPSLVSARAPAGKHHLVDVESLLPASSCSDVPDTIAANTSRLKVVHRHGPCSPLTPHQAKPSHVDLLHLDQSRVDSIRHRAITAAGHLPNPAASSLSSSVPANTGSALGTGNYVVTVGLGTPKKDFSVVFDTGSDLTWTQCVPCSTCYTQQDPMYDPTQSSSYANISCSSDYCNELDQSSCSSSSTCMYQVLYGDNSQTQGSLVSDTLTLAADSIPNFRYGCGHENSGLFGKSDGLLGLGRDSVSIVSQTAQRYNKAFSYCLPSKSSYAGFLQLGAGGGAAGGLQYTPMQTNPNVPSLYFIKLVGISVGAQRLPIPPTTFTVPGTLLDSGTVISRLPPAAYAALRGRFSQLMTGYPKAPALSILDTCYDFTGYKTVKVPTIGLLFDGGLTVNVDVTGILYVASLSQACLAFAGNGDPGNVGIIGNVQQRRLSVFYDAANLKIGFGANGCS